MNNIYLYDGSFDSLLILISKLLILKNNPNDIKYKYNYTPGLLDNVIDLDLESERNNLNSFINSFSLDIIHTIYYVYLSANESKELVIYYFLKNALKYHNDIYLHRNLKCVNMAINISNYVGREAHKLKGFLRFKLLKNNLYYAEVNPTNNVLPILANHFKKRLKNECWLIMDVTRKIYALYDKKEVYYLTDKNIVSLNLELEACEKEFEDLWKNFFDTIGIKERHNLKVQRNFMPKKYWNYIIEMENKI